MKTLLALVLACASMFAQNPVALPSNGNRFFDSHIIPQVLVAGVNTVTGDNAYLAEGSWISAAATPVVVIIRDGNGIQLGNSWTIAANNSVPIGTQFKGAYFPGGIVIQCVSGCSASNANYYMAWTR